MLKFVMEADMMKRLALQHYYNRMPPPPEFTEYEGYFIINELGQPVLIVEEHT